MPSICPCLVLVLAITGTLLAGETLEIRAVEPNSFSLHRAGGETPLMVVNARPHHRPYIHPIHAPDGSGILTEAPEKNYNWHLGLWFGLNNVNRKNFWSDNAQFHPKPLNVPKPEGNRVAFTIESDWQTIDSRRPERPPGPVTLTEYQAWTITDHGDHYTLDLVWTAKAGASDVVFGKADYGGLFVRLLGGRNPQNSEGVKGTKEKRDAPEALPARWMLLEDHSKSRAAGKNAFVAIMDHPANLGHPVPWRVSGSHFGTSLCKAQEWTLKAGESAVFRYRVLVASRAPDISFVESQWKEFAGQPAGVKEAKP
jgi:hypothetical protein